MEAFVKAVAEKMTVYAIQPTQSRISFPFSPMSFMQSPMGTYNADISLRLISKYSAIEDMSAKNV
jgi:hypothetical protein